MLSRIFFYSILFLLFGTPSCSQEKMDVPERLIGNTWVQELNSNEIEGIQHFSRDTGQYFAPARYRQTFTFRTGGSCTYRVLAPNDGHYLTEGTWTYTPGAQELKIFDQQGAEVFHFQILECSESQLICQLITP